MELYSRTVVDHFVKPRLTDAIERVDGQGTANSVDPDCPDEVQIDVHIKDEQIVAIRQKTEGCVATVAAASFLAERVAGSSLEAARALTEPELRAELGGVPDRHKHCLDVPIDALASALDAAQGA
jgi:NifU-like protein involved in Fe-S cluster formation